MNILAIDQGTSATKALVLGPGNEVLGSAEEPVHPRSTADGGVEQDPEELYRSVLGALGLGVLFYIGQWLLEPGAMRTEEGAHGADALTTDEAPAGQ